jgi:hypothetical protein
LQLEQLETRVLLTDSQIASPLPPVSLFPGSSQGNASVTPLPLPPVSFFPGSSQANGSVTPRVLSDFSRDAVVIPSTAPFGQIELPPVRPEALILTTENVTSSLFLVGAGVRVGTGLSGATTEGRWETTPQNLDGSPFVPSPQGDSNPNPGTVGIVVLPGVGGGHVIVSESSITGSGASGIVSGVESPSLYGGRIVWLGGPFGIYEEVQVTPGSPSSGLESPPNTTPGGVSAFLEHGPEAAMPPGTFVESGGAADPEAGAGIFFGPSGAIAAPPPVLDFASRGVLIGTHLVGKTSTTSNPGTTESGTTSGFSAVPNSNVPLVLLLQRQDPQDPASGSSEPAQGPLGFGTLSFSTAGIAGIPAGFDSSGQDSAEAAAGFVATSSSEPAAVITPEDLATSDPGAGFYLRLPTGPLASRDAGPLGPMLVSSGGDPTPEVDRYERALNQEIERTEAAAVNPLDAQDYAVLEADSTENGVGDGPVATVSGGGGFPLKVSALSKVRRTNLGGLLSAIGTGSGETDGSDARPDNAHWIDRGLASELVETAPARDAGSVYAELIKAACGVAIGLGMSSRALFPELLTSVRRRIMSRLQTLRAKSRRR